MFLLNLIFVLSQNSNSGLIEILKLFFSQGLAIKAQKALLLT